MRQTEGTNEQVVPVMFNSGGHRLVWDSTSRGTSAAVVWYTYHATNSPSALNASPSARHPHPLHKLAMNYRRLMSLNSWVRRVISDAGSQGASAAVVWNPYRATNSPSALNASPSARHPHPLHKLPPPDAPQLPASSWSMVQAMC